MISSLENCLKVGLHDHENNPVTFFHTKLTGFDLI